MNFTSFFRQLYEDDPLNIDYYLECVYGLIHDEAADRGIEFDGYFQSKWLYFAETIGNFDEEYFSNIDRRNLYVFKAAELDPDIWDLFKSAYIIAGLGAPKLKDLHREIFLLEDKGVKF